MNTSFSTKSAALILSVFTACLLPAAVQALEVSSVGVVEDSASAGAVRIDALGETQTAAASYRQAPFAVAPDALRKFTASGLTIIETGINEAKTSELKIYDVHGSGEIKAMAVHPGGDKLFVVLESGGSFSSFGDELRQGLVFSNDQYDAKYPDDRISIAALNISNELSHEKKDNNEVEDSSEPVTLEGVAYNVTDIAVSPDGGYALITAMGETESRATPFGVMPGSDELTGGVFVVDLNTFETVDYLPTALKGENTREVRKALVTQGNRIKHPVVQVAESNVDTSRAALDTILTSSSSAYSLGSGITVMNEYLNNTYIANLLSESYQDFGFLAAYATTYPHDMIGATGVGISNRGDIAFVTMEDTNNLGVIPISVSTLANGELSLDVSTLGFESASPKTINGENIDWSYSASGAAANSPYNYWGPADVAFAPDDSMVLVGAYGGSAHRFGTIDLANKRDLILSADPSVNFVDLQGSTMTYPKHVAGIPAVDNDGDGLSNHLEAFNRWNAYRVLPVGDASTLAGAGVGTAADVNVPARAQVSSSGAELVQYLLPHSGVGYRFDYLSQEKFSVNAGNAYTVQGIEKLGRAWEKLKVSNRPYFIVQNIAQPGGGFSFNRSGELVHYSERYGRDANFSYFSKNSDEPCDVVLSNDPSQPRNNTISGMGNLDVVATQKLIELLVAEPMVKEIWIDPAVKETFGSDSSKFILRGGLGAESVSRRDCDSFMKVVFGSPGLVDLYVDDVATVYQEDGSVINYWDTNALTDERVPVVFSFSAEDFDSFTLEGGPFYSSLDGDELVTEGVDFNAYLYSQNPVLYLDNSGTSFSLTTLRVDPDLGEITQTTEFTSTGVGIALTASGVGFTASYDAFGIPVYADGYDLDQFSPESVSVDWIDDDADDTGTSIEGSLTAVLDGAATDAYVRISYLASPPGGVSRYTQLIGGNVTPTYKTYYQLPDSGVLRLWKNTANARQLTDYVAPGIYKLSDLGASLDLGIEVVTPDFAGATIEVALDPDGPGPAGFLVSDSVTFGEPPVATIDKASIAFGDTARLTLNGTADRYRLVYDSSYLTIEGYAPGYHESLPKKLTVQGIQPTAEGGTVAILVELIRNAVVGEPAPRASGTPGPWEVYEVPVTPGLTQVGSVALEVTGPLIEWSAKHTPAFNLDPFTAEDTRVDGENQTEVLAVTTPPGRTVKYEIAQWVPAPYEIGDPPDLDPDSGVILASDQRGELYVYAYDAELPSVQTKTLRITVGDCEACRSGQCIDARGYPRCDLGSLDLSIELGAAGELLLYAERPNPTLSQPSALVYPYEAGHNSAEYNSASVLESISGENVHVTISVESADKYTIDTYLSDDLADHVSSTVIENPNSSAYPNCEHLRISYYDYEGGGDPEPRINEYEFDAETATWGLTEGLDLADGSFERKTTVSEQPSSFSSSVISGSAMVENRTVLGDSGEVLAKNSVTYIENDLGSLLFEDREHRDAGADLVTTYDYYSDGELEKVIYPDGSWTHQKSDADGRITQTVEPYQNAEYGTSGDDKLITDYDYSSVLDEDDLAYHPDAPRSIITRVAGQVISRQSYAYGEGFSISVNGDPGDPLLCSKTITYYITDADYEGSGAYVGANADFRGRTKRVIHPDGTETHYAYAENRDAAGAITDEVREVWQGVVDGSGNFLEGTYSYRFTDAKNQLLNAYSKDILSDITTQLQQATAFDDFGRVIETTYLDGRSTSRAYGCCGVQWEKDRLGIITDYTYDALKRVETMTRLGITTTYYYDKLGRQDRVTVTGTDGTTITQSHMDYVDASGMAYSSFDPLNRETSSVTVYNSDGTSTQTTTLPGGATQIQSYDRSGQLLSTRGTAANPATYEYRIEEWNGAIYSVQKVIRGSDANGSEWVEQWSDLLGRNVRTVFPGDAESTQTYNTLGQLVKTVDPDGVTTLYAYNALGQQTVTAVDANLNGAIDQDGDVDDSVTRTERDYTTISIDNTSFDIMRSSTTVYTATGAIELSVSESSIDGLHSWSTQGEATASRSITYTGAGAYEVRSTAADDSYQIQLYADGRLANVGSYTSDDVLIQSLSYAYDEFGRQSEVTDARTGTTSYTYFADGQVDTITAPDPEQATGELTTSHLYNDRGLLQTRTLPDLSTVHYEYTARGQMEKTYGSQTYPVKYTYTDEGRLHTMTTWQDYAGLQDAAVTEWVYDSQRGWLDKKYDAKREFIDYEYTAAGRLKTRTWARGLSTTYDYNNAGQLATTDYSDATPDIAYSYTRYGQVEEVRDGFLVSGDISDEDLRYRHRYTYDAYLRPLTEQIQTQGDYTLTRSYESNGAGEVPGRYRGYSLVETAEPTLLSSATYGYDTAGRLSSVAPLNPATTTYSQLETSNSLYAYEYVTGTAGLISRIQAPAHTALYDYQPRGNQVRSLINHTALPSAIIPPSSSIINRHDYRYNQLGQRKDLVQSGTAYALDVASPVATGSIFDYTYNAKGEVTAAARYEGLDPDSLTTAITNDSFTYSFDDIGNRETAQLASGDAPALPSVTYEADSLNQYSSVSSASSEVNPTYDQDGNLEADANFSYTWNAENRLVSVTPLVPEEGDTKLTFTYDYQGRRVSKKVETYTSGLWSQTSSLLYIYDGWNLIAEFKSLQTSSFTLQTSYTWGLDLSGSLQGAGGVGGLLQVTENTGSTYSPYYDANGNVVGYFDNSSGEVVAHYEYGPFGELIRATGDKAGDFNFRFSTKYQDVETGLLYYGFRYYDAETGRWLSRDPFGEQGGLNLYGMVGNNLLNSVDYLGLSHVGDLVTLLTDPEEFWIGKAEDKMKSMLDKNPATKFWFTAAELGIAIGESVNREFTINLKDLNIDLTLGDLDKLDRCMIRAGFSSGVLSKGRSACVQLELCAAEILGRTATLGKLSYQRIVAALEAIPRGAAEFVKDETIGILKDKASQKLGFNSKDLPMSDVQIAEDMGEFLLESLESEIKEIKLP